MKRLKTFEQMNENIGPALDDEFATNSEQPLKLNQRYKIEKDDTFIEFYISSIYEENDEVYMNIVLPDTASQGITLSSLLAANPVEVDEPENNIEENED